MNRTASGRGCSSRPRSGGPSSLTVPHGGAKVHHHPQHVGSSAGYGGGGGEFVVHTPEDSYDDATLKACVDECEKVQKES